MPATLDGHSLSLLVAIAAALLLLVLLYREVRRNRHLRRQYRRTERAAWEAWVQLEGVTRALRDRNAEFSAIMDNVPVELVLKDLEGRYLMVNRHFENLNGVTNEAARGKLPQDVFESASAKTLHEHEMEILRSGATRQFEIVQDLGDDAWTFLCTSFPIRRPDGRLTGLGGSATDVTQLKKSEDALKRLNEELESRVKARTAELAAIQEDLVRRERLAAIGEVAATVSHELRNPLSAIEPSLYVLRKVESGVDERSAAAIDRIDRNLRRCDRLIEGLLDFASVGQQGDEPLPLDPWLSSVVDELAKSGDVPHQRCLAAPGVQFAMDEDRMRRAVVNVWTNACQAFENFDSAIDVGHQPRVVVSSRPVGLDV